MRPPARAGEASTRQTLIGAGRPQGRAACTLRVVRVEIKRRMGEADVAAVSKLFHAAALADDHRPLGEHQWLDLVEGGRTGFAGLVAREPGHGHPVGYAQVSRGPSSWAVELVVDPHHRGPSSTVWTDLLGAALREIGVAGGGHVHLWVPKPGEEHDRGAALHGLSRGRELFQMRRPLPVPGPSPELATRPFRPGADEIRWLEVNNRAFLSHPEQGGWDEENVVAREREPWFEAEGFLLHERQGRLAGFCWTKIHHDVSPALGEIYVVAVDPDFQGLGLGRQLVLCGLAWLAGRGLSTGMLYVDSANEAAVALYRGLGFTVDHVDRAYVANVVARTGPVPG